MEPCFILPVTWPNLAGPFPSPLFSWSTVTVPFWIPRFTCPEQVIPAQSWGPRAQALGVVCGHIKGITSLRGEVPCQASAESSGDCRSRSGAGLTRSLRRRIEPSQLLSPLLFHCSWCLFQCLACDKETPWLAGSPNSRPPPWEPAA